MAANAYALPADEAKAKPHIVPLAHDVPTTARLLGIGVSKCWMLIRDGQIRPVRLGKRTLVPTREIERLLTPSNS